MQSPPTRTDILVRRVVVTTLSYLVGEFGIRKIDLLGSNTALNYKFGLIAQVRFNELRNLAVRFNELLLLAPNSFEGGAKTKLEAINRKSLTRWRSLWERDTHVI